MRDRYGAQNDRSLKLRFHAQTAGYSLTWQQSYNNIVRTALQAMSAILGGAQSLHANSLDEAYALPSEQAVTIALRTHQILAYETGIAATPDPLGGSYFVEKMTLEMEFAANEYIERIDQMRGMIAAIEAGFPQTEIAAASYRYQSEVERGERVTVGANRFQSDEQPLEQLQIDQTAQKSQEQNLAALSRSLSGLQTNWTQFVSALVVGEPATAPEFVLRLLLSRELRDVQVRISVAVTLFDFFTRLHFCRLPFGHGHTTEFFFKTKPPEGMNINPPG